MALGKYLGKSLFSISLLTVSVGATFLTLAHVPLLKHVDADAPLDIQVSETTLADWKSRQAFELGKESPQMHLTLARDALVKNPNNANLWTNYSLAALQVNDRAEAHRALMRSLWLVPYDASSMTLRLRLIGKLFHLMSDDEIRLAIKVVKWNWSYHYRAVTWEISQGESGFEQFLRLHLARSDRELFLEIMDRV